ncbi:hypothetical protein AB0L41_48415 [Amycolatopsis mediterranei]|uniref:hypothetical protein n=1 Tax=Amycolatopsis mediterranei TaxID=33910 RepID=UPI0034397D36
MSSDRGERLLTAAMRLLPRHRRELGTALLVEMSMVPPGRARWAWLVGGMWFVMRESALRVVAYGAGVAAAAATLILVDRSGTSDDSSQVSLLVLLAGAAVLGFAAPRWAWLSALLLGSALAVSGLITALLDPTAHLPEPGGPAGAATLFVLVVPALAGAYLGVGAARLRRRRHSGPTR